MKKALIISAIANDSQFGRSRTVQFARALHMTGKYKVDFVTFESSSLPSFVNDVFFIKNRNYKDGVYVVLSKLKHLISRKTSLSSKSNDKNQLHEYNLLSKVSFFKSLIEYLFDFYIDPISFRLEKSPVIEDYDFVFSSYSPFLNHTITKRFKRKSPKTLFVYDFRDPVVMSSTHPLFRKSINRIVSSLIKPEDLVTSVTEDSYRQLNINHEKVYILSNGYEKMELSKSGNDILEELNIRKKKLTVLFAGTLYEGRSDLAPMLLAIERFTSENKDASHNIQFLYIGNNKRFFDNYYGLDWSFEVKSFEHVSRNKIFKLYNEVDIVVISSWNYKDFPGEGDPSSKIYELLNFEKPLVALINKYDTNLKTVLASTMKEYGHEYIFEFSNSAEKIKIINDIKLLLGRIYRGDEVFNFIESDKYNWDKICLDFLDFLSDKTE